MHYSITTHLFLPSEGTWQGGEVPLLEAHNRTAGTLALREVAALKIRLRKNEDKIDLKCVSAPIKD